jgi:hypothetical protein
MLRKKFAINMAGDAQRFLIGIGVAAAGRAAYDCHN